jgi:hypothetical protein
MGGWDRLFSRGKEAKQVGGVQILCFHLFLTVLAACTALQVAEAGGVQFSIQGGA